MISRMRASFSSGWAVAEALEVLHAAAGGTVAAGAQFGVQPLQHAQAELALALDGDDPRVRQLVPRRRP